jgi:putative hydrolase of the HAD superfamily
VWIDFGGVLTPPVPVLVHTFCERVGITDESLLAATVEVAHRYGTRDPMEPLEASLATEAEWSAEVEHVLAERFDVRADLSDFARRWLEPHDPDPRWHRRLRALSDDGYVVGLLSNMMPSFEPHWRALAPPVELFDAVILSFEVGLRKPDPAIFALAAERARVPPSRCVLVDDVEANCAGARASGWRAVLATTPDATIETLDALLEPATTRPA